MSIHPTTTNAEIQFVCESIKAVAQNHEEWGSEYEYHKNSNEFTHKNASNPEKELVKQWFSAI